MILLPHILLATISTVCALLTVIYPSKTKLHFTLLLTIGTILSGTIMTVSTPQLLGRTCITGIIYLVFILTTSVAAQRKLAVIQANKN